MRIPSFYNTQPPCDDRLWCVVSLRRIRPRYHAAWLFPTAAAFVVVVDHFMCRHWNRHYQQQDEAVRRLARPSRCCCEVVVIHVVLPGTATFRADSYRLLLSLPLRVAAAATALDPGFLATHEKSNSSFQPAVSRCLGRRRQPAAARRGESPTVL
jgi:hypothetical protein